MKQYTVTERYEGVTRVLAPSLPKHLAQHAVNHLKQVGASDCVFSMRKARATDTMNGKEV
jgi:hypothetical protein